MTRYLIIAISFIVIKKVRSMLLFYSLFFALSFHFLSSYLSSCPHCQNESVECKVMINVVSLKRLLLKVFKGGCVHIYERYKRI